MSRAAAMTLPRIVQAEILDGLAAGDPRAQRSRRDLVRVHRAMGTRAILRKALRGLRLERASEPLRILELGAGDGNLLLRLARDLAPGWPRVELTLLDRQPLVAAATIAGFAQLGWTVRAVVADALDWAQSGAAARQVIEMKSAAAGPWQLIVANLFLHHFSSVELSRLLPAIAARSERVVACEPRRARLALVGSHLLGAIGAGAVTREDAVLSVHAGFRGEELSTLWRTQCAAKGGEKDAGWRLAEYPAGLFSHCFVAEREPG
ncbi:MAG: hypothetical protein ABI478_11440 [Propionivibrio sp.]